MDLSMRAYAYHNNNVYSVYYTRNNYNLYTDIVRKIDEKKIKVHPKVN